MHKIVAHVESIQCVLVLLGDPKLLENCPYCLLLIKLTKQSSLRGSQIEFFFNSWKSYSCEWSHRSKTNTSSRKDEGPKDLENHKYVSKIVALQNFLQLNYKNHNDIIFGKKSNQPTKSQSFHKQRFKI